MLRNVEILKHNIKDYLRFSFFHSWYIFFVSFCYYVFLDYPSQLSVQIENHMYKCNSVMCVCVCVCLWNRTIFERLLKRLN